LERSHKSSDLSDLINPNVVKLLKTVFHNFTCLPGYSKQKVPLHFAQFLNTEILKLPLITNVFMAVN
jgi:hypothetical protein